MKTFYYLGTEKKPLYNRIIQTPNNALCTLKVKLYLSIYLYAHTRCFQFFPFTNNASYRALLFRTEVEANLSILTILRRFIHEARRVPVFILN